MLFPMQFKTLIAMVALTLAGLGMAADGVPEVSRDIRAKAAAGKLQIQKEVALLYVKGMT